MSRGSAVAFVAISFGIAVAVMDARSVRTETKKEPGWAHVGLGKRSQDMFEPRAMGDPKWTMIGLGKRLSLTPILRFVPESQVGRHQMDSRSDPSWAFSGFGK